MVVETKAMGFTFFFVFKQLIELPESVEEPYSVEHEVKALRVAAVWRCAPRGS